MPNIPLHRRNIPASQLVLGCMGLGGAWNHDPITNEHTKQAHAAVDAALSIGINMFDHADIYTKGKAEQVFGQVLKESPSLREHMIIQSKCCIRPSEAPGMPGRYDASESHITTSVDGILQRLGLEYIDILLLHRPDPLMDPEEVALTLDSLHTAGKVRWFGVSNMSAGQIRLLQAYSKQPFIVNQLEMSLAKIGWLNQGVQVNTDTAAQDTFPEGTLEFCRLEHIQLQAWAPLAQGVFSGRSLDGQPDNIIATAKLVQQMAADKGTTPEAIVLAWLMFHPANIQPVIGTVNPDRIRACKDAGSVVLTREEWYSLYVSSRGVPLP
ncbi:aldo/keto reductase [Paenibacillus assamensis]|uniref:aldo/keto reductase n=1 Tax=Paenibacillus assamensis TaxID=311244 RepID=UPI000419F9E2|nr:aldo/keto reductase [Paenibacillus assamensis]